MQASVSICVFKTPPSEESGCRLEETVVSHEPQVDDGRLPSLCYYGLTQNSKESNNFTLGPVLLDCHEGIFIKVW